MIRKKWIAFFLITALIVSTVSACTTRKNNEVEETQTTTATPGGSKAPEPATLTFGTYHVPADTMDNFDQTAVGKAIKEQLNITVKIRGSQNVEQDFIADVAANNLPDIFAVTASASAPQNMDIITKAAKEGMLADLTDFIKNGDAPILNETMKPERMPLYTRQGIFNPDFNEKLYLLPAYYSTTEPGLNGWGLYLRGDIAKALNVDTKSIQTPEDLYHLAKLIKEGNFKDVNGKPVYPIGMIGAWGQNLYQLFRGFDYGKSGFTLIDGKIKSFIESDQIWEQILFVRKLVNEGLIDQESFAHSYQIGSEKVSQGRNAIMPFQAVSVAPGNEAVMKALTDPHPEMVYAALSPMKDYTGSSDQVVNMGMEAYLVIGVSKKANAEAAVKLLNWINSKEGRAIINYGEKDKQWFFNDKGFAQMTDEAYKELLADSDAFYTKYGAGGNLPVPALITGFDSAYDIYGGTMRDPYYQSNPIVADKIAEYVSQTMPNTVVKNQLDISGLMTNYPEKDKLLPVLQQLKDILAQSYLVKTEKGARDILEGYRETLHKSGYQDYIQFLQQEYDKDPSVYLVSSGHY
ncbi:extracellular solute-binding protein [Paenibacillus eucommiae]|uniref:Aldouronate transport system substrate-binding protein n=1 Tax=Paenibacillus eucommiae TaxID=1355755 RepID=A0ABS4J8Y3_9BACL|nr:extracellular solute-binding protein [Paenibacillus eucommiae]MBP1996302.1 putative aldouronate transport system substrate-binding protein [Paenibacillus eucommiae]